MQSIEDPELKEKLKIVNSKRALKGVFAKMKGG